MARLTRKELDMKAKVEKMQPVDERSAVSSPEECVLFHRLLRKKVIRPSGSYRCGVWSQYEVVNSR